MWIIGVLLVGWLVGAYVTAFVCNHMNQGAEYYRRWSTDIIVLASLLFWPFIAMIGVVSVFGWLAWWPLGWAMRHGFFGEIHQ